MEERRLNEKESLELITQMIQNTRRNLDAGDGNMFLLWGYVNIVVTLGVWLALYVTENPVCWWGFWVAPVIGWGLSYWLFYRKRSNEQWAKGYTDIVIRQMWQIVSIACCGVALIAIPYHYYEMILPLCAMLISLASLLTGIVIRYTVFSGLSSCGFAWSIQMLYQVVTDGFSYNVLIVFALIIFISMVIPGHLLNRSRIVIRK